MSSYFSFQRLFWSFCCTADLRAGFARLHFQGKDSEQRKKTIIHTYPDGIEARNAPFPLILILTIVGFLLWAVFYILGIGLTGVNI
jgi:hypothetical protein